MRKKRISLVSQYLEGISGEALEEYQDFFREATRGRNGVYALYRGKRLYYVGLARDLRGRLKQHLRNRHGNKWDRFSIYLTIGDQHLRELESLVLRIVQPRGNRQIGKFQRAQNLRHQFSGWARLKARLRLNALLGRDLLVSNRKQQPKGKVMRAPVLAAYSNRPHKLRAIYKGEMLRARVRRDGSISFRKERFNSPSLAAHAAIGRKRPMNGWWFWNYERAPGDWVRLKELRR